MVRALDALGGEFAVHLDDGTTIAALPVTAPSLRTVSGAAALGDYSRLIRIQGTIALALTPAAALSPGWSADLVNEGTGVTILAPGGTDTIDGTAAPRRLLPKQKLRLVFDGVGFFQLWLEREPVLTSGTITSPVAVIDVVIPDGCDDCEPCLSDVISSTRSAPPSRPSRSPVRSRPRRDDRSRPPDRDRGRDRRLDRLGRLRCDDGPATSGPPSSRSPGRSSV